MISKTSPPPLLELDRVAFHYGLRTLFKDLSLQLEPKTCTALIGPNGVGKTTLLRIAAGTLAPTAGTVTIFESAKFAGLATLPAKARAKLIALVPQQLAVPFQFTVQQIVEQGRSPYLGFLGGPTRQDRLAIDRALALTDTTALRRRIFNELSGGERQRVKIALGLAQQPRLLLLDEPTQSLDIGRQAELLDLLQTLLAEGLTLLASMHDLHLIHGKFSQVHLLAPATADTAATLTTGPPETILTPTNLTRAFRVPHDHSSSQTKS